MLRFGCIDINSSSVKDISQYNAFRAISCFSFIGRGRERREKRGKKELGFPIYFSFGGSRETREKSYEIDVRFIRTVESHSSISNGGASGPF